MKYYPIVKNWSRKIKPHLVNGMVQMVLVGDFNRFTYGRWHDEFKPGMKPTEFELCDWHMNFLALGVDADEAWRLAREKGRVLAVGKEVFCHYAQFYKDEDSGRRPPTPFAILVEDAEGVLLIGERSLATEHRGGRRRHHDGS